MWLEVDFGCLPLLCFTLFFSFNCFLWDRVSLCSLGCPDTQYVEQAGLKITEMYYLPLPPKSSTMSGLTWKLRQLLWFDKWVNEGDKNYLRTWLQPSYRPGLASCVFPWNCHLGYRAVLNSLCLLWCSWQSSLSLQLGSFLSYLSYLHMHTPCLSSQVWILCIPSSSCHGPWWALHSFLLHVKQCEG